MSKLFLAIIFLSIPVILFSQSTVKEDAIEQPLYKPLIERYILDELKSLRQENQSLKAHVTEQVSEAKLESSDRAINYTTSTINNIFYIITAAASMLVLLGWHSLKDIKKSLKSDMSKKIQTLTTDYENR
ncbi:MAG: hypothetical protein ACI9LN_004062, partial [Saprospiraceae bacterium]